MAKPAMSASVTGSPPSFLRSSARVANKLCTTRHSASAESCFRSFGALTPRPPPSSCDSQGLSQPCRQSGSVACGFTKSHRRSWPPSWGSSPSGHCCDAPLPARPNTMHLTEQLSLTGNDQLAGLQPTRAAVARSQNLEEHSGGYCETSAAMASPARLLTIRRRPASRR
jgi:hypothetical protein